MKRSMATYCCVFCILLASAASFADNGNLTSFEDKRNFLTAHYRVSVESALLRSGKRAGTAEVVVRFVPGEDQARPVPVYINLISFHDAYYILRRCGKTVFFDNGQLTQRVTIGGGECWFASSDLEKADTISALAILDLDIDVQNFELIAKESEWIIKDDLLANIPYMHCRESASIELQ